MHPQIQQTQAGEVRPGDGASGVGRREQRGRYELEIADVQEVIKTALFDGGRKCSLQSTPNRI